MDTAKIAAASKELQAAQKKLDRITAGQQNFINKQAEKAAAKYDTKVKTAAAALETARKALADAVKQ